MRTTLSTYLTLKCLHPSNFQGPLKQTSPEAKAMLAVLTSTSSILLPRRLLTLDRQLCCWGMLPNFEADGPTVFQCHLPQDQSVTCPLDSDLIHFIGLQRNIPQEPLGILSCFPGQPAFKYCIFSFTRSDVLQRLHYGCCRFFRERSIEFDTYFQVMLPIFLD